MFMIPLRRFYEVFYQPNKIIEFLILFGLKIKKLTMFREQNMNVINQRM